MFPRKLDSRAPDASTNGTSSENDFLSKYEISDNGYGKNYVKILHIKRDGLVHNVKEFEVNTHLKLYSKATYFTGKICYIY